MNKTTLTSLVVVSVFTTLLSGCTPSPMKKAQQDFVCKGAGGVYRYTNDIGNLSNKVQCRNGEYKEWTHITITPEFYPDKEDK